MKNSITWFRFVCFSFFLVNSTMCSNKHNFNLTSSSQRIENPDTQAAKILVSMKLNIDTVSYEEPNNEECISNNFWKFLSIKPSNEQKKAVSDLYLNYEELIIAAIDGGVLGTPEQLENFSKKFQEIHKQTHRRSYKSTFVALSKAMGYSEEEIEEVYEINEIKKLLIKNK